MQLHHVFGRKAYDRRCSILPIWLARYPASFQRLSHGARCVAASKRVEHEVTWVSEETDEKFRELCRHARWVNVYFLVATEELILVSIGGVGTFQKVGHRLCLVAIENVRWNGPAIILRERVASYAMLGRPDACVVAATLNQLSHVGAIRARNALAKSIASPPVNALGAWCLIPLPSCRGLSLWTPGGEWITRDEGVVTQSSWRKQKRFRLIF
jgi:hypothetical protein